MGEQSYVTQEEHREFVKRMENENDRQNHRLGILEQGLAQINDLSTSVKVLAVNMENMVNEQRKQGEKLSEIEGIPKKKWETLVYAILAAIGSALVTAALAGVFK